jgi:hypothetical protein
MLTEQQSLEFINDRLKTANKYLSWIFQALILIVIMMAFYIWKHP